MQDSIPNSLRNWFVVHFFVDLIFAVPLILVPALVLPPFGFSAENLLLARLVGAALFAIGTLSLITHRASLEVIDIILSLKIFWGGAAAVVIVISIFEGAPRSSWLFLSIFIFFVILWSYYKKVLKKYGKT